MKKVICNQRQQIRSYEKSKRIFAYKMGPPCYVVHVSLRVLYYIIYSKRDIHGQYRATMNIISFHFRTRPGSSCTKTTIRKNWGPIWGFNMYNRNNFLNFSYCHNTCYALREHRMCYYIEGCQLNDDWINSWE